MTMNALSHRRVLVRHHPADTAHPLLETLICETHNAALLTAATTSIVNVLRNPAIARSPGEIEIYLPKNPALLATFPRLATEAGVEIAILTSIVAFFSETEAARGLTSGYFTDARLFGIERAVALHQYSLSQAWRNVCHAALDAVGAMNGTTADLLPELYHLNAGVLGRLLNAAARGESPCVAADGQPFLPVLPQRRQAGRKTVGQPALLSVSGTQAHVYVRDVSLGGLGLESVPVLRPGTSAVVELATGRRLTGEIVWYERSRAGLKFAKLLPPGDPLISG